VIICTPMPRIKGRLERITVEWHRARMALALPTGFAFSEMAVDGLEVGEARTKAAEYVVKLDPQPEFLFFLDYDVIPAFDALTKLFYRARTWPDYDIIAGIYCSKGSPPEPLIYKDPGNGCFWDWAIGDVLHDGIHGVHMGLTLIRVSLFEKMMAAMDDEPLFYTANRREFKDGKLKTETGTEDLHFCDRAIKHCGAKILVDTSVLAGHINNETGVIYGLPIDSTPVMRCPWMKKHETNGHGDAKDLLKALDLGAGSNRRMWDGYETITTDIREDVGADFVMDSRLLNLPDDYVDLVATSHHLEHIPRWEQEQVWKEMARVLKPGGRMEHVIPNLRWAAWKVANCEEDGDTFNVLYGSQEEMFDGPRQFNTHYFGYSPQIAKTMAESVGMEAVQVRTYEDDDSLGYNMVLTARKPETHDQPD
jgi:SAM-dependent methyltransferase